MTSRMTIECPMCGHLLELSVKDRHLQAVDGKYVINMGFTTESEVHLATHG